MHRDDSTHTPRVIKSALTALAATGLALVAAGCSSGMYTPVQQNYRPGAVMTGTAMGGRQPINGGTVQLYAAGTSSLKSAATPLITSALTTSAGGTGVYPVLTNANGSFTITGDYACPVSNIHAPVYLTITGGDAGSGSNPYLGLMIALGDCTALQTNKPYLFVNEITTVAGAYALSPFMGQGAAGYTNVSGPVLSGVNNAFTTAGVLANTGGATPGTVAANSTVSSSTIISLANALAYCINSTGNTCSGLFSAATPTGGTAPTDTITAAANIASSPGSNVNGIWNQIQSVGAPWSGGLAQQPQDWSVTVKYTDPSLASPYGVAVDASGNAWITNEGGFSVTEIAPGGTVLSGSSGYTGSNALVAPQGIAIDKNGAVWIANTAANNVVQLSGSNGSLMNTYASSNISGPVAVAIDSNNTAWVANYVGNSITSITTTGSIGSALTGSGTAGTLNAPLGIAVDAGSNGGNVWVANTATNTLAEFSNGGSELSSTTTGVTDGNMIAPYGVAVDTSGSSHTGNVWSASYGINAVNGYSNGRSSLASPYIGGGVSAPQAVAVDGASAVWSTDGNTVGALSKIALVSGTYTVVTPSTGLGTLSTPVGVAVDASGNVWTANSGDNSVTQFVGLATPVTTPMAANAGP